LAGMENSVLALIIFFVLGLAGLFAALRSEKLNHEVVRG